MSHISIETATQYFKQLLIDQEERIMQLSHDSNWINYNEQPKIVIGICWGDGIGEHISKQAERVLRHALSSDAHRIEFKTIAGLTIENRSKHNAAIPADVLAELKSCHVILKGPTTTPQKGDGWPNIESANVAMRRELDLFACVRPIKVPEKNIDWVFFRENTEGAYMLGSKGFDLNGMSIDFKIISDLGSKRIIQLAFEYAKKNQKPSVTVVTKSNVIKATDGRFSQIAKDIAADYAPNGIRCEEWYVDIMAAKLIDPQRQRDFNVFVLPNLYGDILTDLAGQIQGGVGTAGSANIGKKYAMFEAVHGSAPRMVREGRSEFADPSSMIKAATMLLNHIGYPEKAQMIEKELQHLSNDPDFKITGHPTGITSEEFTNELLQRCLT
jgi:isocitrate dehydrogenase (NAD+)